MASLCRGSASATNARVGVLRSRRSHLPELAAPADADVVSEYMLVHELMHLRRMDHSPPTGAVAEAIPAILPRAQWLRNHGSPFGNLLNCVDLPRDADPAVTGAAQVLAPAAVSFAVLQHLKPPQLTSIQWLSRMPECVRGRAVSSQLCLNSVSRHTIHVCA
jgi:hypothetical protein